ncbi:hypothetical protein [Novipirellula rosea]|uniref:hypothetical protein n=1 Tax=Novipirellula rosea TaxID=1031540 RepID=UPI0031EC14D9
MTQSSHSHSLQLQSSASQQSHPPWQTPQSHATSMATLSMLGIVADAVSLA